MSNHHELPVPAASLQDTQAFELLRIWIANKKQHVSLRTGVWKDPAAWGVMLSDLMKHIADAYYQENGLDRMKTLQRIREGLVAELSAPTDSSKSGE